MTRELYMKDDKVKKSMLGSPHKTHRHEEVCGYVLGLTCTTDKKQAWICSNTESRGQQPEVEKLTNT